MHFIPPLKKSSTDLIILSLHTVCKYSTPVHSSILLSSHRFYVSVSAILSVLHILHLNDNPGKLISIATRWLLKEKYSSSWDSINTMANNYVSCFKICSFCKFLSACCCFFLIRRIIEIYLKEKHVNIRNI